MIAFLTVTTAVTLTEAFGAGALLGLSIYSTVKNKKPVKAKRK